MSNPTTPTVGRIVHYRSRGSADGVYPALCRAAVVTEEATPLLGKLSLAVLNPTGMFFDTDVVRSDQMAPGSWHWPSHDGPCNPAPQHPGLAG
jgi:hypothetical protein